MKTKFAFKMLAFAVLLPSAPILHSTAFAQGTAFTYQGRLHTDGAPANDTNDFTFTLFLTDTGGAPVAGPVAIENLPVSDGLFTTPVDFGMGVLTGAVHWLEIGVRPGDSAGAYTTLSPRQKLTPTPYAVYASNAGTAATVAAGGVSSPALQPGAVTSAAIADGNVGTVDLTDDSVTSAKIANGTIAATDVNTSTFNTTFWKTDGNAGTTPGTHFVGTTDQQPLDLRVNGIRAFRVQDEGDSGDPDAIPDGAPNVIGGSPVNFVAPGVVGATISGGGATNQAGLVLSNSVAGDFGVIAGGGLNAVGQDALFTSIRGGVLNQIDATRFSSIGGGLSNRIGFDANATRIGGGEANVVDTRTEWATISGGWINRIHEDATGSAIGGGVRNVILDEAESSAVAGGELNEIGESSYVSAIGGGYENRIHFQSPYATIAGGFANNIYDFCIYSAIGGGLENEVDSAYSVIAGGSGNVIGDNSSAATIGGGALNLIEDFSSYSVIAGGESNRVAGSFATVGGGLNNESSSTYSTVPGGRDNRAGGLYSFAAGRRAKADHLGTLVWADSQDADFPSAGPNEFAVRASGGVRLVTGGVGVSVDGNPLVSAPVTSTQIGDGAVGTADLANSAVTSAKIANGTIAAADVNAPTFDTTFWRATGNAGTTPGTHFLGTTDNQPLEFKVNNLRCLRFEPSSANSINIVGGWAGNLVGPGVIGATIAGGGVGDFPESYPNEVHSDYSTIGGGIYNSIAEESEGAVIAGGAANRIEFAARRAALGGGVYNSILSNAWYASIGGGHRNLIGTNAMAATISGGETNIIGNNARHATIAGGYVNNIGNNSSHSAIGGGSSNNIPADSTYATIPGGRDNIAQGDYSFAAGRRARANHNGAFVWADSTDAEFPSDRNDQFKIRANGGVHLQTGGSGLNPAGLRVAPTTGNAVGLYVFQTSSDAAAVFENRGAGLNSDQIKAFNGPGSQVFRVDNDGDVIAKSYASTSDRNRKENFTPVNPSDVLEKIAALPISRWNFKGDAVVHMGPMAQDFHAAFGVGPDDKHIATVDADGVALAALQGLNQKVEVGSQKSEVQNRLLEERLARKETEIAELRQRLQTLERAIVNLKSN